MVRASISLSVLLLASATLAAQGNLDRSFPVSGRPSVQVETDNAAVTVHSCGGCRAVSVHIDLRDQDLSEYRLEEGAAGNMVHVRLKRREENHGWFNWHNTRQARITVDMPQEGDLNAETGNGEMQVSDIHGDLRLHTGNGDVTVDRAAGSVRADSGNGAMKVRDGRGRLSVTTGNGAIEADGRFVQVDGHTGNGKLQVRLPPGTALEGGVHLSSGNGEAELSVPRDLRASLDLSTGSGRVHSDLAVPGDSDDDRHRIHGTVNGGGPTVRIETGSGDVRLSAL